MDIINSKSISGIVVNTFGHCAIVRIKVLIGCQIDIISQKVSEKLRKNFIRVLR